MTFIVLCCIVLALAIHSAYFIKRFSLLTAMMSNKLLGQVLLLSEQCRVKLTAGRVKSQRGVVGIADVMTSLFLKPTACRSLEHQKMPHSFQNGMAEEGWLRGFLA